LRLSEELLDKVVRCAGCQQTFSVRSASQTVAHLRVGSATSIGLVRQRNEDSLLVQHLVWATRAGRHELALLVVADGMGGHQAGDRASALAVGTVARALAGRFAELLAGEVALPTSDSLLEAVDFALWEAHRTISRVAAEEPGSVGMGATAVIALILDGVAAISHVGDCRAYHANNGTIRQLTQDQTVAQRLVGLGQLTQDEARRHPSATQVTQALGRQYDLEPSRQSLSLRTGDLLLLACDGLHAHLDEKDLHEILYMPEEPDRLAKRLIDRTNNAGGNDNCTVIVVRGC
jgi:protein phosphatase